MHVCIPTYVGGVRVKSRVVKRLSKKTRSPWHSRTPGLVACLWQQQPPSLGNLIAMGSLMQHTKDFIQILQMVKKIINLMKAFILFYSLPPPTSTAPRTFKYRPPCVPRRSHVLYYPSPVAFALFGWLLCAIIDWRPLN